MMMASHSVFWGSVIVIIGIIVILKMFPVFRNISVGRIIGGLVLIYIGLSILIGDRVFISRDNFHFRYFNSSNGFGKNYSIDNDRVKYDILFGSDVIDLKNIAESESKNIKISVAFGSATVKLGKNTKAIINGNVAFGGVDMPKGNRAFFGEYNYTSDESPERKSVVYIKSDVAFGYLNIVEE